MKRLTMKNYLRKLPIRDQTLIRYLDNISEQEVLEITQEMMGRVGVEVVVQSLLQAAEEQNVVDIFYQKAFNSRKN